MNRISKLEFCNFKFFRGKQEINIDGKHLLLYGENGSGKSSIFWGIHMLLDAAMKIPNDTKKYFLPLSESDESMINLYKQHNFCSKCNNKECEPYVSITNTNELQLKLSHTNDQICGDISAIETRKACDFINYQSLFLFQRFDGTHDSNLFAVFRDSILPFIDFPVFEIHGKELRNAREMWEAYCIGPGKITNPKGATIQVYKHSREYHLFLEFEKHFNDSFHRLIDFVNNNAINILKKLGYDFNFTLTYVGASHKKLKKNFQVTNYSIILTIDQYNSTRVKIIRPHKFLNEAKLTAMALSIRIAVLQYRISSAVPTQFKILALDDIMVSLDMSNRDRLTNLILNDLTNDFQILLFTHEKNFYNFIKNKISQNYANSEWLFKEMYVADCEITQREEPVLISREGDYFKIAKSFYKIYDYSTAAFYLRKEMERIMSEILPPDLIRKTDVYQKLSSLWSSAKEMYSINSKLIADAENVKRVILNPAAHHQKIYQPLYRKELQDAFNFLEALQSLKLSYITVRIIVSKNEILEFRHPVHNYSVKFQFKKDFKFENDEINDPKVHIHSMQYNGIANYDFAQEKSNPKLIESTPKFSRFRANICNIATLKIKDSLFLDNTFIENCSLSFLIKKLHKF